MIPRLLNVAAIFAALALLAVSAAQTRAQDPDDIIKKNQQFLTSQDPAKRAAAVEFIAAANTRKAAKLICDTLAIEKDADAQQRMGAAFEKLKSGEALEELAATLPKWTKSEQIFPAYYALCGIATGGTESGDAIFKACIVDSKPKDYNLKAAGLEAIGQTQRKQLAPLIADLLATWDKEWDDKGVIVAMCAIFAAPKVVAKDGNKDVRDNVMRGLINLMKNAKNDRVVYFAVKSLATITGEKMYSDPKFWEWWISVGGYQAAKDRPEGETTAGRKVPEFFGMATVGKRVVFCIDVSGSMQHPAKMPPAPKKEPPPKDDKPKGPTTGEKGENGKKDEKKEEKEIEPPDYSKVKNKLDLAKVELIYALKQLDKEYLFNVTIYDTGHQLLIPQTKTLQIATEENKNKFIRAVEALNWRALTNIHGGLMDSFSITERDFYDWHKMDPAWHEDCLARGAETIFFLTDGAPTISDDTTNGGEVGRPDKNGQVKTRFGNGKMVQRENIIAEIKRVNTFRKCVIHTVGIGIHDSSLLGALARDSGGTYTDRTGVASDRD